MIYYAIRKKGTDEYLANNCRWFAPKYTKENPRLWTRLGDIKNYMVEERYGHNDVVHRIDHNKDHEIIKLGLVEIN